MENRVFKRAFKSALFSPPRHVLFVPSHALVRDTQASIARPPCRADKNEEPARGPRRARRLCHELGRDQNRVQDGGRAPPVQAQEAGPRLRLLPRVRCQEGIPVSKHIIYKKGGAWRKDEKAKGVHQVRPR